MNRPRLLPHLAVLALVLATASLAKSEDRAVSPNLPKPVKDADYRSYSDPMAKLGQKLFYDRVLSGTYRVSCATCHNHDRASSNGFLLPDAKGAQTDDFAINGLSIYDALKPSSRHAPVLFNLGAKEFVRMLSDGRVEEGEGGEIRVMSSVTLPKGIVDVLAAQALIPAVTADELIGTVDNDVKQAAQKGHSAIWNTLAARVRDLPDYEPYFKAAYPELKGLEAVTITEIANAIGAFSGTEWRADRSPFDAYLRGDKTALTKPQKRGLDLFYGKANCGSCHSGAFQTDHEFHGAGLPVWRSGESFEDKAFKPLRGRKAVNGNEKQAFHFRTPTLRNIAHTAPYGWAGSYETLKGFMEDHLQPQGAIRRFVQQRLKGKPLPQHVADVMEAVENSRTIKPINLSAAEKSDLLAFLKSLTDKSSLKGRLGKPEDVPSSLAID